VDEDVPEPDDPAPQIGLLVAQSPGRKQMVRDVAPALGVAKGVG
jgi:hypothetical protein